MKKIIFLILFFALGVTPLHAQWGGPAAWGAALIITASQKISAGVPGASPSITLDNTTAQPQVQFKATNGAAWQFTTTTNDQAVFQNASGGYIFDAKTLLTQVNIKDTTGVILTAPGAATVSVSNLKLDTFAAAALDTVVTLTGTIGDIVYISTRAATRDLVFLDSGNFQLGAARTLSDPQDVIALLAITTTLWKEIHFNDNN